MKHTLALVLTLCVATNASAQSVDVYRYFKSDGIFDPGVTDETANALVRAGIASEDAEIRDLTVRALGEYAMHAVNDLPTRYGSLRERSFAVPELKSTLIAYWREQHERSGYDTVAALQRGLGLEAREGVGGVTVESLGLPEDASPDDIFDTVLTKTPAWTMVPQILCELFPGDSEVLELVWERETTDVSPENDALGTLTLLNVGRFATSEANAFRIDALAAPSSGPPERQLVSRLVVTIAARGLAFSQPLEAFPHLIAAAFEHPNAKGDILVVLAGYDDDVLSAYASELAVLLSDFHGAPMGAVSDAVSRLETFIRQPYGTAPTRRWQRGYRVPAP